MAANSHIQYREPWRNKLRETIEGHDGQSESSFIYYSLSIVHSEYHERPHSGWRDQDHHNVCDSHAHRQCLSSSSTTWSTASSSAILSGPTALAAVGTAFPIIFLMISLVMGLTMGTMVLVAQFYRSKELRKGQGRHRHRLHHPVLGRPVHVDHRGRYHANATDPAQGSCRRVPGSSRPTCGSSSPACSRPSATTRSRPSCAALGIPRRRCTS